MKIFYFLCLIYILHAQKCQPYYWQIDPKYQLKTNQIQAFASTAIINIPDIQNAYVIQLLKSHYYIQNILTKITIDTKNKQVKMDKNKISVSGIFLNLNFEYDAIVNGSKKYNGKGKSSLANVSIGFSKQFILQNGNVSFVLSSADISPINKIKIDEFIPNITNSQMLSNFDQFINHDLYNELKNLLDKLFIIVLDNDLKSQSIQNSFGDVKYTYRYQDYTVSFNTTISSLSFNNGKILGYDGSIIGKFPDCSIYLPDQLLKSTVLTLQFLKNTWDHYSNSQSLQNLVYDSNNIQTDLFQFYLIDLEDVIPSAINIFKKPLSKLKSICSIDLSDNDFYIDTASNSLFVNVDWKCRLLHSQTETEIINLQTNLNYKVSLSQMGNKLILTTTKVELNSVKWYQVEQFPVINANLAEEYLKDLLKNFDNIQVLGTNFIQPLRKNPKFIFEDGAIFITDIAQQKLIDI